MISGSRPTASRDWQACIKHWPSMHRPERAMTKPWRSAAASVNRQGEANCLRGLADVHQALAEYAQAQARYDEALAIYQGIGDRSDIAHTWQRIGHLCVLEGRREEYLPVGLSSLYNYLRRSMPRIGPTVHGRMCKRGSMGRNQLIVEAGASDNGDWVNSTDVVTQVAPSGSPASIPPRGSHPAQGRSRPQPAAPPSLATPSVPTVIEAVRVDLPNKPG